MRNSVGMLPYHHFGHKERTGVPVPRRKAMLAECGVHWEDLSTEVRQGSFVSRDHAHGLSRSYTAAKKCRRLCNEPPERASHSHSDVVEHASRVVGDTKKPRFPGAFSVRGGGLEPPPPFED